MLLNVAVAVLRLASVKSGAVFMLYRIRHPKGRLVDKVTVLLKVLVSHPLPSRYEPCTVKSLVESPAKYDELELITANCHFESPLAPG